jgi:hypothetical protein
MSLCRLHFTFSFLLIFLSNLYSNSLFYVLSYAEPVKISLSSLFYVSSRLFVVAEDVSLSQESELSKLKGMMMMMMTTTTTTTTLTVPVTH